MRIDPLSNDIFNICIFEDAFFPEYHERYIEEAIPAIVPEDSELHLRHSLCPFDTPMSEYPVLSFNHFITIVVYPDTLEIEIVKYRGV